LCHKFVILFNCTCS